VTNKLIIKKANDLVEARYRLSLTQQRLILYLNAQIKPWDTEFQTYEISVTEFCKYLEIDPSNIYEEFLKISQGLISKSLIIGKDERTIVTAWLSSAIYNKKTGVITLRFSPELKDFLLELKKCFTIYSLNNVKKFKSTYAYRIYELLKQYINTKERERVFEIAELREILQTKELYKQYYDFKKNVLFIAQKELLNKSDIRFEFEEIKKGRSVAKIRFLIHINEKDATDKDGESKNSGELKPDVSELSFIKEPLTELDKHYILQTAEDIEIVKVIYQMSQMNKIEDLTAWMIAMIRKYKKGEVSNPVKSPQKNKFANFEQRDIDFELLERLELEQLNQASL